VYTELKYPLDTDLNGRYANKADAALLFTRDGVQRLITLEFKKEDYKALDVAAIQVVEKLYAERVLKWLLDTHGLVVDVANVHCCAVHMKRRAAADGGGFELEWKSS
jgi:hypothetical protein